MIPSCGACPLRYARSHVDPSSERPSERRIYHRYVLWFPVTLIADGREVGTICRDASTGGLLVSAPVVFAKAARVTCRFRISPEESTELTAEGRVLRCSRNADDLELVFPHRVAIEFDTPKPEIEESLKNAQARLRESS